MTPLHIAADRGEIELARVVLAAGPDLTIKDSQFHGIALGWAHQRGHSDVAQLIQEAMDAEDAG